MKTLKCDEYYKKTSKTSVFKDLGDASKRTLPRFLRLCRRRLKNALMPERHHFASKNGILFCRRILSQKPIIASGGRAQADTCGKRKMAPNRVPFFFWCG